MIAVVTGSNGFIGRHLCKRLEADGMCVRAALRADLGPSAIAGLMSGADLVFHAAGATRAPSRKILRASNVELTRHVAAAAAAAGVGRFVFISSLAAVGPAASRYAPLTEDAPAAPVEPYGQSKLDAERVVRSILGFRQVIVRPSAVYGPGDRDFLTLFRLARRGVAIHPANRQQWISLLHVDDVVDGIVRAAWKTVAGGQTFFLANDRAEQWSELFRIAARSAGRTVVFDVEIPLMIVRAGALIGDWVARMSGRAGLLTSAKVALGKPPFWVCSSARAQRTLGFLPHVTLEEGFAATYAWYLSNGWL